jgi:hypothetical protein
VFGDAAVNVDDAMVTFDSVIVWCITSAIVINGDIVSNVGETTRIYTSGRTTRVTICDPAYSR